jgi:hypothetical protein
VKTRTKERTKKIVKYQTQINLKNILFAGKTLKEVQFKRKKERSKKKDR